jgi:ribulose-phosphate 3-epimerase
MDKWIAPSILSADFAQLGEEVDAVLEAGADLIHFDVMDNHYVPNLTVGPLVCAALHRHAPTAMLDIHLMVEPVDAVVPEFAAAGASYISFHPEATRHVDRTIELIRHHGCHPGLVLNPATPLNWLDYTLEKLDLVLIMSVNPGFGGQEFIPEALDKLVHARERIAAQPRPIRLEIDGGVKIDNIGAIARAGADTFVAGSAIFGSEDYIETLRAMRAEIERVT